MPSSIVSSAPVIERTPSGLSACAISMAPCSPSWSVSASASWPCCAAAAASSTGCDAPSRNEYAEWQWSSTYDTNVCSHTYVPRCLRRSTSASVGSSNSNDPVSISPARS